MATIKSYTDLEQSKKLAEILPLKSKEFHPATKEQRDFLFQKMHEAGYEWDADKKELKSI